MPAYSSLLLPSYFSKNYAGKIGAFPNFGTIPVISISLAAWLDDIYIYAYISGRLSASDTGCLARKGVAMRT